MSGLILIFMALLWLLVGAFIARRVVARLAPGQLRAPIVGAFLLAWLTAPWIDEYLGSKQFARLCDEMPDTQFFGPVSLGEGPFYDSIGNQKWHSREEFDSIARAKVGGGTDRWNQTFPIEEQTHQIADWPIPVLEQRVTFVHRSSGKPLLVSTWRGSPGGWVKRLIRWGSQGPYQCSGKTPYPDRLAWIKF